MTDPGKRIFISRRQTPDSVFYKTLTEAGFSVYGASLIDITPVPFSYVPAVDWIFFYSKNGVRCFFEQVQSGQVSKNKFAVIGPGTADFLEEYFAHPDFVGDGHAETTARAFLPLARGKKILFPRAENSRRSVQQWLEEEAELIDLIVYDNVPKKEFDLPDFDLLVFTSPLNAEAYFSVKKTDRRQTVLAIGSTTASALFQLGIKNVITADNPSEQALAQTILNLG